MVLLYINQKLFSRAIVANYKIYFYKRDISQSTKEDPAMIGPTIPDCLDNFIGVEVFLCPHNSRCRQNLPG